MVFQKIITICVLYLFCLDYIESVPTFGNEYVHIKVHIPSEPSSSRGILKPKELESAPVVLSSPKVIHHYHRRRRPSKKVPKLENAPLLENVLLAELDKPDIEETYVVEEEHHDEPITKVNTYKVIEETRHKPIEEKYIQHQYRQPHREYGKENVETFKVIEEHEEPHQHYHKGYQKGHAEQHVETIKFVEEKPLHNYHQHAAEDANINHNYHHHKPQEEIIKIIETPKYKTSSKEYLPHYETHQQDDKHYNHQQHVGKDHYDYHKPQHETIEIVKTKVAIPNGSAYKNYHSQNYQPHDHEPVKETIEITKTKTPVKYHYETEGDYNYDSKSHYDDYHQQLQEEIIKIKGTKYSKSKQKYHYEEEAPEEETPEENYHYNQEPKTIIEEHIYKKPSQGYHYSQPAQKESYNEAYAENDETDYRYQSSYQAPSQLYITPSPPLQPETKFQFKPSQSYSHYDDGPKYKDPYMSNNYAGNIEQHLPSIEKPTEFQSSHNYQAVSSPTVKQNTFNDELRPSNVDWPGTEDPQATETYTGHDSYSAGHVQGVGSGGYKYPLPYP